MHHKDTKDTKRFLRVLCAFVVKRFYRARRFVAAAFLLGRSIRLFEDRGQRAFRQRRVHVDADPAADADVGRDEEVLGIGGDEILLRAERRVAPDGDAAVAVMVVREHREEFAVDAPRRLAPRDLLLGVRHAEADFSDEGENLSGLPSGFAGAGRRSIFAGSPISSFAFLHDDIVDLDPELF